MDIDKIRDQPHLSASSISTYIDCGLQYKFSRIDKLPQEFRSDSLVFGSTIHQVLAAFHEKKMVGSRMTKIEMQNLFMDLWKLAAFENEEIRYSKGKNYGTLLAEGKDMLAVYDDKFPGDNFRTIAIEEPFKFYIENLSVPLIGFIDLVEEDDSGTIIIVDHKTAAKAFSKDQIDKNDQLTIYQMSARANGYKDREILLRFDAMIKTKTPNFAQYYTTRSELDERRLAKRIKAVWDGIQKGVFLPNVGHWKCGGCQHRKACDSWLDN